MMTALKIAHWVGVLMLLVGLAIYGFTSLTQQIGGMLLVSSLIGLGLVLMSPFPIVLFIQWGQKQEKQD
ncbi:hypothetical protein [Shewanella algidipiscicola]|uniref:Uncharacterized protein n=1 Tax=Shewanella algidipiscicola TaxID=614070 RepID=A0ABQ4PIU2_9GAMM|nr:hypothetical protein [Shewanella algidipiscicola]GIU47338.1 hypothetical protein TUM4630_21030 [Shewanella algidipiscicola]